MQLCFAGILIQTLWSWWKQPIRYTKVLDDVVGTFYENTVTFPFFTVTWITPR